MKKILMTQMMNSISEVMETMFFLPVEFDQASGFEQAGLVPKTIAAGLDFSGEASGFVTLVVPVELAHEMSANFLGEPREHLSEKQISETLTEMLNMVCGNGLGRVRVAKPFKLGLPRLLDHGDIPPKEPVTVVETMSGKMALYLELF